MEAVNVVSSFLFKEIVDRGELLNAGLLSREAFGMFLLLVAGIYLGVGAVRVVSRWLIHHLLMRLDGRVSYDVKNRYFRHILGLSHEFHTTHKTGSLISRLNRGAGAIEGLNDVLIFNFAPLFFSAVIVGGSLATVSPLSAVTLLSVAVVFISYSFFIQHIQQKHKLAYNNAEDREKGFIADAFMNVDSIKYFGKERTLANRFSKKSSETYQKGLTYGGYYRWFDSGQSAILAIGTFLLLYFPFVAFLRGELSLGSIVFVYTIYGNLIGPMFGFVWGMRGFYRAMGDVQDLFHYGKIENDIRDSPHAKSLSVKKGSITFQNVDFKYGKRSIFKNFNLEIKPNERVAFVGHSGCGKSTLIKLLNRLYDVDSGAVLIDGKDIRNFTQQSVRSETGIVPQECILFDDTLYNNIKFAKPNATKQEVMRAIRFAQLDKILKHLPQKEHTIVGERGVKLSGGEKQRVSIARALLANKKILVLDEATSALDSETEHEIQQDLDKLLEGRTSISIAHRLSTIMKADRIIVMKRGKIVEEGTHGQLLRKKGEYYKLWGLQKGGYLKD